MSRHSMLTPAELLSLIAILATDDLIRHDTRSEMDRDGVRAGSLRYASS